MNCYLDSSVVLRILFNETHQLPEWSKLETTLSSRLLKLECLRVIQRYQMVHSVTNEEAIDILSSLNREIIPRMALLPVSERVFSRAEEPFSIPVGTLDSIHLATALLWREQEQKDFIFATHDTQLALAARAHGFEVIGVG